MDEKILKDAQYRKGLSIAFFNATNAAIGLITSMMKSGDVDRDDTELLEKDIQKWRNWFLAEHKEYYGTVIAQVGSNYKAEESIAKLKTVQSSDELKRVWISFSEDERRDGEIRKVAQEIKNKYEKV